MPTPKIPTPTRASTITARQPSAFMTPPLRILPAPGLERLLHEVRAGLEPRAVDAARDPHLVEHVDGVLGGHVAAPGLQERRAPEPAERGIEPPHPRL